MEKLSPIQRQILRLTVVDGLTVKQIANRRGTTEAAVYKIIRKLKKKGYAKYISQWGLTKTDPPLTIQPPTNKLQHGIRLHGQEFNCKILWKSPAYDKLLRSKNLIYFDNNTVRLYRDSVEVYSAEHREWLAEDEQRATALSMRYWSSFFGQLEQRLHVILIKGMNTRIRQVNAHYAEINNELAKDANDRKVRISIFGTDDAKLWFKIDNSWQLNEAETLHSDRSKQDMQQIKRFFNDVRDNNPPTVTELTKIIHDVAVNQQMYAENIVAHIAAIQQLGHGVEKLTKLLETMEKNRGGN